MELLKKLTQCDGASGNEKNISAMIEAEVRSYADEIYSDALGNLVVHKKGNGKKIMFAAHMDEIGIVVTYIGNDGFLRFSGVGGLYTKNLINRKVRFENGIIGVIGSEQQNEKCAVSKMYIDISAKNREEAEKYVSLGDTAAFVGDFYTQNDNVISKALDNRAGCYVLIETLKKVKSDNDLYFVFTVQEEVGLRGARTAAYSVEPDYAIAVDVTDVGDTPECEKVAAKLGGGAAIKVMDYSVICDFSVREKLIELAKNNNIAYQLDVITSGGTDAGVMHLSRGGVRSGGISVPARYIHSPSETVNISDLKCCIELTRLFAENI